MVLVDRLAGRPPMLDTLTIVIRPAPIRAIENA
jgi:hypothetical protein